MKSLSKTVLGRVLGLLAHGVTRHGWIFIWPQFLLFAAAVVYTCFNFHVDLNRDDLVGGNKSSHKTFLEFKKEFPAPDDIAVVAESDDLEKNRQFVERLGHKLALETNLFTDVFYKGDMASLGRKPLFFVPNDDLKAMQQKLNDFLPFISQFTQVTNLTSLFSMVNYQIYHAKREANSQNDALIGAIPMLTRIVDQATDGLRHPGNPPSPGVSALFGATEEAQQQIYITFLKGRLFLLTALPVNDDLSGPAINRMRQLVADTAREVPGVNVGVTGESVLDYDEMNQSQADATRASIISLVLCALIFIYGYQETGRPLKATVCLIVGLGYTMAFTMLVVGHLNILTVTFAPILIGLAIDFGVHLITRYEEELRHNKSEEEAMRMAMVFTGQGIFTGAMTTAVAFLAMALTDFKGIQEMGIICGGGMIVCFIPMMTMLPALLLRGRQNVLDHIPQPPNKPQPIVVSLRARIENIWLRRPKTTVVLTVILTILAATQLNKLYFDYDLQHMQSAGLPAVVFGEKMLASQSVLFAAVVADSPEQAVELEEKLKKLPSVSTNISMAPFLTGNPAEKLKLISDIQNTISRVHFKPIDRAPVAIEPLSAVLYSTAGYMGNILAEIQRENATNLPAPSVINGAVENLRVPVNPVSSVSSFTNNPATPVFSSTNSTDQSETNLIAQLEGLRSSISELRKQMLNMDSAVASDKLAAFQQALFGDVLQTFETIQNEPNHSAMQVADLPSALRNRFVGISGKYLIQVYPKKDIWQHDNQQEFINELRTVAPNVTGTPVQLLEYTTLLKNSYIQAAYYALAVIALMVAIHFRSIVFSLLALVPVGIGVVWMCGLMGALNIPFNPANIMTLPLVIGIGVTNGIHILNRYIEENEASILSKSTGKAVFVSGLTAISGFGSLILAKHLGIRSLGEVMSLGVALCMVAALTFLPSILNLWGRRGEKKQPSGDNARSTLGREEPR